LGCFKDAPLWFWPRGLVGYEDFITDFVESFAVKYIQQTNRESILKQELILTITRYRSFFGQNQTKQFLELSDPQNVEKVLDVILSKSSTPNAMKARFDSKILYDSDEEKFSINSDFCLKFQSLPSENFTEPISPIFEYSDNLKSDILLRISEWWLKKSEKSGIMLTQPLIAKQIIQEYGCVCRYLIQCQNSLENRQKLETLIFQQLVEEINNEISRQRFATVDIFTIQYKVFRKIPFLVDFDLIRIIELRRHVAILDGWGSDPTFVNSEDSIFQFRSNKPTQVYFGSSFRSSIFFRIRR